MTLVSPITVALVCGPSRLPFDALVLPEGTVPLSMGSRIGPGGDGGADDSSEGEDDEAKEAKAMLKLDEWMVIKAEPMVSR